MLSELRLPAGHALTNNNESFVLILIPAFNAARYLPTLIERLRNFASDEHILFVNDGSHDNTADLLSELGVRFLDFNHNRGKGAALKSGFEYAIHCNYRSVLCIDADLQHLPEEIPRFHRADDGTRIIIGTRDITRAVMPFSRWLTNNLTSLIISLFSSQRVRDSQSGFRLLPVSFLRTVQLKSLKYDFESEMLFQAGASATPIVEVPISTIYEGSHSYINPFIDTLRFIRQIWRRIWL